MLRSVDVSCLVGGEGNDSFQHFGENGSTMSDLECVPHDRYSVYLVMTSVYVIILPTSPWGEGSEETEQTSWAHGNRGKCENRGWPCGLAPFSFLSWARNGYNVPESRVPVKDQRLAPVESWMP